MSSLHAASAIPSPAPSAPLAPRLVLLGARLALMRPAASDPDHDADDDAGAPLPHPDGLLDALEHLDIGTITVARLRATDDPGVWQQGVERLLGLVEDSPAPGGEWATLAEILGDDLLGELVGVSRASLARYRSGQRSTPDEVAARLHHLAMIVADLAGSYNSVGIRRWFTRRRSALGGRPPAMLLSDGWDPDDEGPQAVRELAAALLAL